MSTNGLLLYPHLHSIAPYLDWIGLPLDADNSFVNELMRPGNPAQFSTAINLIRFIKTEYPQIGVKLRTVVCKLNKDAIFDIPSLIGRDLRPDVWKLYQVVYDGYGFTNKSNIEINDIDFERVVVSASLKAVEFGIHVKVYRRFERNGRYLFLYPNGDAAVALNDKTVVLGNAFSCLDTIANSWQDHIITERMNSHLLHR